MCSNSTHYEIPRSSEVCKLLFLIIQTNLFYRICTLYDGTYDYNVCSYTQIPVTHVKRSSSLPCLSASATFCSSSISSSNCLRPSWCLAQFQCF